MSTTPEDFERIESLLQASKASVDGQISILSKSIAAIEKQFGTIAIAIAEQAAVLEAVIGVLSDDQKEALVPLIAEQRKAMFDVLNHVSSFLAETD